MPQLFVDLSDKLIYSTFTWAGTGGRTSATFGTQKGRCRPLA